MWAAPGSTRVVFDISAPVDHNLFVLHNPERVVIDLQGARREVLLLRDGVIEPVDGEHAVRGAEGQLLLEDPGGDPASPLRAGGLPFEIVLGGHGSDLVLRASLTRAAS